MRCSLNLITVISIKHILVFVNKSRMIFLIILKLCPIMLILTTNCAKIKP